MSDPLSHLTIVRCTPAQTRAAIDRAGDPPSIPADREWLHAFADHQPPDVASWALVPRDDPDTLDLLAHCDTYRRRALVLPANAGADAEPEEAAAYGIVAMFTPPHHRGKGYATRLLQLLHYVMAPRAVLPPFPDAWGPPPPTITGMGDAAFSFLYSGIDGRFYMKCTKGTGEGSEVGWVPKPPRTRVWTLAKGGEEEEEVDWEARGWRWLSSEDIPALQDDYARVLRAQLTSAPASKRRFALVPYLNALTTQTVPTTTTSTTFGAALGDDPAHPTAWITYIPIRPAADMPRRIVLSHVEGDVPFALVRAAARRAGAEVVEWGAQDSRWDAEAGGVEIDEEWPKPCVAVYGGEEGEEVEWVASEMPVVEGVGVDGRWAWY